MSEESPSKPNPFLRFATSGLALRLALAALAIAALLIVPSLSAKELQAELRLFEARGINTMQPDSRIPELKLREAVQIDPHNGDALYDLARVILNEEKTYFETGQYNNLNPDRLQDVREYLARAMDTLPYRPSILRMRAETNALLMRHMEWRGQGEEAEDLQAQVYADFAESASLQPYPRDRNHTFNLGFLIAAYGTENFATAVDIIHTIDRLDQRWAVYGATSADRLMVVWQNVGMWPHFSRELRLALNRQPRSRQLLNVVGETAQAVDLWTAHIRALENLAEQNQLGRYGRMTLEYLQDPEGYIQERTQSDESP